MTYLNLPFKSNYTKLLCYINITNKHSYSISHIKLTFISHKGYLNLPLIKYFI